MQTDVLNYPVRGNSSMISGKVDLYLGLGSDTGDRKANLDMALANLDGAYNRLLVAPHGFKNRILELMDEQIALGAEGYILLKFNSLTDIDIIAKISEASCAHSASCR